MTLSAYHLANLPEKFKAALDWHGGFFTSFAWYSLFIDTVSAPGLADDFFLVYDGGQAQDYIILPVRYEVARSRRSLLSLTNYYSPVYGIVQGSPSGLAHHKLGLLLKGLSLPWDVLELQPMAQNHAADVLAALTSAGIPARCFCCFGNWYLDVNGRSYAAYFAGLSSRVRHTVLRKAKKFAALQDAKLLIVCSPQEVEAALLAYHRVYQRSWKTAETYPGFISGLCRLAAAEGALRLGLAYIKGVAVAAQLWIVADNTAYIYKLAYDEAYKNYGVGTLLTATLMQHVIDIDKVAVVDYLTGDDAYKKDWMSHRRERWGVLAFNTSRLRGLWAMFKALSKSYVKKMIPTLR